LSYLQDTAKENFGLQTSNNFLLKVIILFLHNSILAKMVLSQPNEQHEQAIKNLYFYKDPKETEGDIDALIEWLSKQPHLPNITGLLNYAFRNKTNPLIY